MAVVEGLPWQIHTGSYWSSLNPSVQDLPPAWLMSREGQLSQYNIHCRDPANAGTCFQLRTQGQAHGNRVQTRGLVLGVCKDSSGPLSVGQWCTAGGHTSAWGYKTVTLLHWDGCTEGDGVYAPVWEMTLENETKIIRIFGQRLFFHLMSVQFLPHSWAFIDAFISLLVKVKNSSNNT